VRLEPSSVKLLLAGIQSSMSVKSRFDLLLRVGRRVSRCVDISLTVFWWRLPATDFCLPLGSLNTLVPHLEHLSADGKPAVSKYDWQTSWYVRVNHRNTSHCCSYVAIDLKTQTTLFPTVLLLLPACLLRRLSGKCFCLPISYSCFLLTYMYICVCVGVCHSVSEDKEISSWENRGR
jgi:hypothetical protein